jgi:hypothetical protein
MVMDKVIGFGGNQFHLPMNPHDSLLTYNLEIQGIQYFHWYSHHIHGTYPKNHTFSHKN